MSNAVPPGIPAGWYSDPTDTSQLRWWNGSVWTAHVQQRPAPVPVAPVVSAPIAPAPVVEPATAAYDGTAGAATTSYASDPATRFASSSVDPTPAAVATTPLRWNTVSSWFVALSPFFYAIAYIIALPVLATAAGFAYLGGIIAGALVIPFVIAVIFATVDHSALKKWGHPRPASTWWILLTPLVYLIVRTVRVRRAVGRGSAPLWVWIAAWAVSSAIIGIATVQILPAVANFQNSSSLALGIQDGMNSQGGQFRVTCPPTAPLTVGARFSCTARDQKTQTSHILLIDVIAGVNGQPTIKLESVTPPITP